MEEKQDMGGRAEGEAGTIEGGKYFLEPFFRASKNE